MKASFRKRTLLIVLVMIMIWLVPLAIGGMDVIAPLFSIAPIFFLYFVLLVSIKWVCIVYRSQIILRYNDRFIRKREIAPILFSYEFISDLFPKNIVAPIVCLTFFKKYNIPYSSTLSLGFFSMVLDTFSILLIVAGGVLYSGMHGGQNFLSNPYFSILFFALFFVVMLLILFRKAIGKIILKVPFHRFVPASREGGLSRVVAEVSGEIAKTENIPLRSVLFLLLLSLASWASRMSFLYIAIMAVSHGAEWVDAMLIQVVSGAVGALTFMPGGFPGADITATALLASKLGLADTLAILVLWRIMTFYTSVLIGGAALSWLGLGVSLRSLFSKGDRPG